MKKLIKEKNNSLSFAWKASCWFSIFLIIIYNLYLGTLSHNLYMFLKYLIVSIVISILIYLVSYSIAEIIQLLEDIKNK